MFQISFEVMFYTLGKLLNNWSMLRMRRGKDKDPHMLSVLGWWSLYMFESSIYGWWAQTYLDSISLKPKACEDIYLPAGAERKRIHNTDQLFKNLPSV